MTERDEPGGTPHAAASQRPAESERPAATSPPLPSMTAWGRRAALVYLGLGALALAAMAIETVAGHPGIASMFAAFLAVPWSMLVAGLAPPLPRDWPLAAGLAVRMLPLALFMLLNAAIVAGIAARSERDLTGRGTKAVVLVLLAGVMLSSGCALSSRQRVLVTPPTSTLVLFNGGLVVYTLLTFDLRTVPEWRDHRAKLSDVTDITLMGDFRNPGDPQLTVPAADVQIWLYPDGDGAILPPGPATQVWKPLHLEADEAHRVDWDEGARRFLAARADLRREILGDGRFSLAVVSVPTLIGTGGATFENFRLGAVLEVR